MVELSVRGVPNLRSALTRRRGRSMLTVMAAGVVLFAGACGGRSSSTGVATLAGASTDSATAGADQTPEQAALAFAACMRDNGVADFPDPTVGADGNVEFGGGFGGGQRDNPDFRTAMDTCRQELGTTGFGPGGRQGNFDPAAIQEAMLPYTQCLRDAGLDVGDLTFGPPPGADGAGAGRTGTAAPGAVPPAPGTGATGTDATGTGATGAGRPEGGGFGDRGDFIARRLGQDPTDPAWIEANKTCQPLLETAFANRGATTSTTAK